MSDDFNFTEWITTAETAELTGYSVQHVRRLIRQGKIKARKWANVWMVDRTALLGNEQRAEIQRGILQSLEGSGRLICKHGTEWSCSILLDQLINGRLRLQLSLDDQRETARVSKWADCDPFAFEGSTDQGIKLTIRGISFVSRVIRPSVGFKEFLVGYARMGELSIESNGEAQRVHSLQYEFTNFGRSEFGLSLNLGAAQIELGHWPSRDRHHDSIARALRTATISGTVRILNPEQDDARNEHLIGVLSELLSLRERALVYWTTRSACDAKGNWFRVVLREPPFSDRGWEVPLIPFDSLQGFLQTAYDSYDDKRSSWRLYLALWYHRQAVTTSDELQTAVSVSTAFETLNAAYRSRLQGASTDPSLTWINPEVFCKARKHKAVRRIYSVLEEEFPDELRKWDPERRKAFKDYLHQLNRRGSSYKAQLKAMLAELHKRARLVYTDPEIDVVKELRDRVFHTGIVESWEDVLLALNLLERTILATLGYVGDVRPIVASRFED